MLITGQKCERTVKRYLARRRDRSLYKASEAVHEALHREVAIVERPPTTLSQSRTTVTRGEDAIQVDSTVTFQAPPTKKMRVSIDGNRNQIDIVFD